VSCAEEVIEKELPWREGSEGEGISVRHGGVEDGL